MKKLLFILLIALVASACKKEKKIERNLWKKGGEWEIKSFEEISNSTPSTQYDDHYIINNGGTIQFNKDESGKLNFSPELFDYWENNMYEEHLYFDFSYYNSANSIFLVYPGVEGMAFDLDWEKDKMVMSYTETYDSYAYDENNNQIPVVKTNVLKFTCEKK